MDPIKKAPGYPRIYGRPRIRTRVYDPYAPILTIDPIAKFGVFVDLYIKVNAWVANTMTDE
jgi:hypothetical protein